MVVELSSFGMSRFRILRSSVFPVPHTRLQSTRDSVVPQPAHHNPRCQRIDALSHNLTIAFETKRFSANPSTMTAASSSKHAKHDVATPKIPRGLRVLPLAAPSSSPDNELAKLQGEAQAIERWWKESRWNQTKRIYSAMDVACLRPSSDARCDQLTSPSAVFSSHQALKLYNLLYQLYPRGGYSHTFGALDPIQVIQMAKHLATIYVSGWQCSSTASTTNEPGPDVADYPVRSNDCVVSHGTQRKPKTLPSLSHTRIFSLTFSRRRTRHTHSPTQFPTRSIIWSGRSCITIVGSNRLVPKPCCNTHPLSHRWTISDPSLPTVTRGTVD